MKTMNPANPAAQNICPYDVGDILQTMNAKHPAERWPGTVWEKLSGKFLIAESASHPAGQTGGNESTMITYQQMPSSVWLNYKELPNMEYVGSTPISESGWGMASGNMAQQPVPTMPPYLAVYIWQRTA